MFKLQRLLCRVYTFLGLWDLKRNSYIVKIGAGMNEWRRERRRVWLRVWDKNEEKNELVCDRLLYWCWDCQWFLPLKKRNCLQIAFFLQFSYIYMYRGENNCMIQCNDLFPLVVVSNLKSQKTQLFSVLFCKTNRHSCSVFKCSGVA